LKSAKFNAIAKGDMQKNTIPPHFQGTSLKPKKLYLAQFREIAKTKKKKKKFYIGR
jgi:hypothetical protein